MAKKLKKKGTTTANKAKKKGKTLFKKTVKKLKVAKKKVVKSKPVKKGKTIVKKGGAAAKKVAVVAGKSALAAMKGAKRGVAVARKVGKKVVKTGKSIAAKMAPAIKGKKVGVVTHWYGNINVAILKLSAPLKVGDKIVVVRGEQVTGETVKSMQLNHEEIASAKKGMEVGVKVKAQAHEGADVYVV